MHTEPIDVLLAPHRMRPSRPAFVTYLYARNTLDDFVAALLEAKARNIGVLETQAAHAATLLSEVIEAAVHGERAELGGTRTEPVQASTARSVGLLEETLDLLARARRGLGSVEGDKQQVFQLASKSRPGAFNTVTVTDGVARCTCEGFQYRGNCSHVRQIAARL
jgi:SWI/SNF-related matrix-associated actin-dependent regulator of chromatin subfamily A-like protein 1